MAVAMKAKIRLLRQPVLNNIASNRTRSTFVTNLHEAAKQEFNKSQRKAR
jgi:hypothetical protein